MEKYKGYSLIEAMIALLLLSFCLFGTCQQQCVVHQHIQHLWQSFTLMQHGHPSTFMEPSHERAL